ncbi:RNA polymerase sigma factor [Dyadobacter sp. CY356]|uniref:RNA polymerase sigma factor n=1 Tax=Dyadobacter sp. CY356 TaxID=2906442 RepID=UPI001F2B1C87|nr:RNA polymerase sigma factor [Dyadobacter sp. CY356]MCF0056080.1 RNA polymerase sigma factor [Dyadobacter sp. CY356]
MSEKPLKKEVDDQNYTDEDLVKLYVQTQRNSYFEKIYERYATRVYQKCLFFVKDSAKAEDLTHDIFFKLILRLSTFKENSKFSTWLYSITYNHCMDQLRSYKRSGEISYDETFEIPDDTDLNNLFDHDDVETKRLQLAMDQLTVDEKGLLLMKYADEMSIRDIAEILKVTESSVKMRLLRTKEKFRNKYMETAFFLGIFLIKVIELLNQFFGK